MNQCMEKSKRGEICKACGKAHDEAQYGASGESYNSMKAREAAMKGDSASGRSLEKEHQHIGWGKLHGKLEREGYSKESADKIAGKIKAQGPHASGVRKAELEVGMSYNDLRKAEHDQLRSPEFVKSLAKNARSALANIKSKTR